MRYLILSILLLVSIQVFSQNSRIKLGAQFAYEKVSGEGYLTMDEYTLSNRIEMENFNFSTGITANFLTNSSFSFQSGLLYTQKDVTRYQVCIVCLWHSLSLFVPNPIEMKQRYLTVPFLVRFSDKGAKLSPIIEAGIYNNFIVSNNEFDMNKSAFMEGAFGLGASYKLNRNMFLELKYSYRGALTAVYHGETSSWNNNDSDPNKLKTQSFQLGLNYLLK